MRMHRWIAAICVLMTARAMSCSGQRRYQAVLLDFGPGVTAVAMNNRGAFVGSIRVENAAHAMLWDPANRLQDLGTLGGAESAARAINDLGQVVGWAETADGVRHAFRWERGAGMVDLGTLGGESEALGLNNNGQIVGFSYVSDTDFHAFCTAPNSAINPNADDLGTLGGALSMAYAVNTQGTVAGWSSNGNVARAFQWDVFLGMFDLGTLDNRDQQNSSALGINEAGQIVGWSDVGIQSIRAALWDGAAGISDLGRLTYTRSHAIAVNSSATIVGLVESDDAGAAFVWSGGEQWELHRLVDPALQPEELLSVSAINDLGQILCWPYLLNPR